MNNNDITMLPTVSLQFDPENPRFFRLNKPNDEVVINEMIERENVQDLMLSIGEKGYFPGEPLLVVADKGNNSYTVIEGNRRLAAVKLLNKELLPPKNRKKGIEIVVDEARNAPEELPCLVYKSRSKILRYLGYRHITGIKEWDPLSKAKYLLQMRDEFYRNLEPDDQAKALAKDIGSKRDYVARLLTALRLYDTAESHEFFGLNMTDKHVEFSYITTAMSYENIREWLRIKSDEDFATQTINEDNLKSLFSWMFVQDQQGNTILGESRKLKELAKIVKSADAVEVLKKTADLNEAYLYTDGPEEALLNALSESEKSLGIVWGMIPKVKNCNNDHLSKSEDIFETSKSIRNALRDKLEDE